MNAAEVRDVLTKRWPDAKYLHIPEAPLDLWRQGSKIDVLIIALWQSLKLEMDAVEIKVSYQDWRREIEQRHLYYVQADGSRHYCSNMIGARYWANHRPGGEIVRESIATTAKSEAWRRHAHRFWIACPAELAARIEPELPAGWGLIACHPESTSTVVKPELNKSPDLLNWPKVIGLLRTAADCGFNALVRAEERGWQRSLGELQRLQRADEDHWDEIQTLRGTIRDLERQIGEHPATGD
jgi:hypothetical protein